MREIQLEYKPLFYRESSGRLLRQAGLFRSGEQEKGGIVPFRKYFLGVPMRRAIALIALAGSATIALAQSDASKPDLAKGGAIAKKICSACHGTDGNSPTSANPKLAGQVPEYLSRQLVGFKANSERKNPVMLGMTVNLSSNDIRDLAAYYASQKAKEGIAKNRETVVLGRRLYRGGDISKGLPACAACHGAAGEGLPAQYPRLAGQYAEYTEAQLRAFRSGERVNDPNRMMRMVAAKMSDAEIKAVSDYIAGLR